MRGVIENRKLIPAMPFLQNLQEKSLQSAKKGNAANTTRDANEGTKDHSLLVYSSLLRNEILGAQIEDFKELSNIQVIEHSQIMLACFGHIPNLACNQIVKVQGKVQIF